MSEREEIREKILLCCSGTRGVVTDQYLDLSQAELIAVIVDKEMVCERDGTLCLHVNLCCRSN